MESKRTFWSLTPEGCNSVWIWALGLFCMAAWHVSLFVLNEIRVDSLAADNYDAMYLESSASLYRSIALSQPPFAFVEEETVQPGLSLMSRVFAPYVSEGSFNDGVSLLGTYIDLHLFDVQNAAEAVNGRDTFVKEIEPFYFEQYGSCVEIDGLLLDRIGVLKLRACKMFRQVNGMAEYQFANLDDVVTIPHILFAALQANGVETLASSVLSGLGPESSGSVLSFYPMYMVLRVEHALGAVFGGGAPDSLYTNLTGEKFSLRLLESYPTSLARFESFYVAKQYGLDGLAHRYIEVGGSKALCGFDRDCMRKVADTETNTTLSNCDGDVAVFCNPVVLDSYKLDAIPIGSFFDRVELPWDYASYREEGARMQIFDGDFDIQLQMTNIGSEVQVWSQMWTWRLMNFPRRTESCEQTLLGYTFTSTSSESEDAPGFDCDSPENTMFAGQTQISEIVAFVQPLYLSSYAKGRIEEPCVFSLECRISSRNYEMLVEPSFGHVLCKSFGLQSNIRVAYTSKSEMFPSAKESLVPLLYSRRHRCINDYYYRQDFDDLGHMTMFHTHMQIGWMLFSLRFFGRMFVNYYLGCCCPMVQPSEFKSYG